MSDEHISDHPTAPAPHDSEHGHGATATADPFGPAEAAGFQEQDKLAAAHIVKLMVGIFIGGVVLYAIVAIICSRG